MNNDILDQIDLNKQNVFTDKEYISRKGEEVRILCMNSYYNPESSVIAIMDDGSIQSFTKA